AAARAAPAGGSQRVAFTAHTLTSLCPTAPPRPSRSPALLSRTGCPNLAAQQRRPYRHQGWPSRSGGRRRHGRGSHPRPSSHPACRAPLSTYQAPVAQILRRNNDARTLFKAARAELDVAKGTEGDPCADRPVARIGAAAAFVRIGKGKDRTLVSIRESYAAPD